MRPPHKVEVSVGDRESLLVDARPSFTLGYGVWVFLPFCYRVLGGLKYTTQNPDQILSVNSVMDVSFSWMTPEVLVLRGSLDWCCRGHQYIKRIFH